MRQHHQHLLTRSRPDQHRPERRLARQVKRPRRGGRHRLGLTCPGPHYLEHRHRAVEHLLPGGAIRFGEYRAQRLMPLCHISQRLAERANVRRAREPEGERDVIQRRRPLQPVQEPQPPLRIRQRHHRRTLPHRQRQPRPASPRHDPGKLSNRRSLEQVPQRHLSTQHRPDPRHQPRRQQRMTPKIKETLINPDRRHPQHLGEQPAQDLLRRRPRRPPAPRELRNRQRGQRSTIDLPVHRQRDLLHHRHRRRHQVIRQHRRHPPPHQAGIQPRHPPGRRHKASQPPVPGPVLPDDHGCLSHPGHARQRRLRLTRLHPEPPDLHLIIGPPRELQIPVPPPPRQITSPVHPPARRTASTGKRARHETLSRQPRPPRVPPRQPRTRHVQLPRHPRRHRPQPPVKHEHPGVVLRPADGHGITDGARHGVGRREHGRSQSARSRS